MRYVGAVIDAELVRLRSIEPRTAVATTDVTPKFSSEASTLLCEFELAIVRTESIAGVRFRVGHTFCSNLHPRWRRQTAQKHWFSHPLRILAGPFFEPTKNLHALLIHTLGGDARSQRLPVVNRRDTRVDETRFRRFRALCWR